MLCLRPPPCPLTVPPASPPATAAGFCPAHLGLAAADGPRPDGARLLVPAENFGDAAVGHSELARDDTGPYAMVGHLHYLVSDMVG